MIILPTRRNLIRKRDALYERLYSDIGTVSVHQTEDIMRRINIINGKLRTYFLQAYEPKEVFIDQYTT